MKGHTGPCEGLLRPRVSLWRHREAHLGLVRPIKASPMPVSPTWASPMPVRPRDVNSKLINLFERKSSLIKDEQLICNDCLNWCFKNFNWFGAYYFYYFDIDITLFRSATTPTYMFSYHSRLV